MDGYANRVDGYLSKAHQVQRLVDLMNSVPVDQLITYATIDSIIGSENRYLLQRARMQCNKENGHLFDTVHRQGIIKLAAGKASTVGVKARRKIRKVARTASDKIGNAILKNNDLTNEEIIAASAEQRILGLHQQLSYDSNVKKEVTEIILQSPSLNDAAKRSLDEMRAALGRGKRRV